MNPNDCGDPLTFYQGPLVGQSFHLSSEISQNLLYWIGSKFYSDIHGFQTMYLTDFDDLLAFPVAPLNFMVLSEIS